MSDRDLRDRLQTLVDDEPPLHLELHPVLARGQRMRQRRRIAWAGGAVGVAAAVAAAVVAPLMFVGGDDRLSVSPASDTSPTPSHRSEPPQAVMSDEQAGVLDAIRENSPADWDVNLVGWYADIADHWWRNHLELTADDGRGPGRLLVHWNDKAGTYTPRPCQDSEYVAGGRCHEALGKDGSVVSMRDVVEHDGIRTVLVTLTYPDGTGVGVESGNYQVAEPPPTVDSAEDKRGLTSITRDDPTYTVDQLARVVRAVGEVVLR